MNLQIRPMTQDDSAPVLEMMRAFYTSPAVFTDGSEEIFRNDIQACVTGSPYLEGYIFQDDRGILGYAMVAKSFSTEFGKPCIWIEDIYLKEPYRSCGIGSQFFRFIQDKYPNCLFRLEVEAENTQAVHTYEKNGFTVLPYMEMKK